MNRPVKETNTRRWSVIEFDDADVPIWSFGPFDKAEAREKFEYVTRRRSQRSDVVLRGRSAALLYRGKVVRAERIRRSRRAPQLSNKRLRHLDADSRETVMGLDLLAARLVTAGLRNDGTPRAQAGWERVRSTACEIWDLVRGTSETPTEPGWWLQEWTCHDSQAERKLTDLPATCPYHGAPVLRAPIFVEHGW